MSTICQCGENKRKLSTICHTCKKEYGLRYNVSFNDIDFDDETCKDCFFKLCKINSKSTCLNCLNNVSYFPTDHCMQYGKYSGSSFGTVLHKDFNYCVYLYNYAKKRQETDSDYQPKLFILTSYLLNNI